MLNIEKEKIISQYVEIIKCCTQYKRISEIVPYSKIASCPQICKLFSQSYSISMVILEQDLHKQKFQLYYLQKSGQLTVCEASWL